MHAHHAKQNRGVAHRPWIAATLVGCILLVVAILLRKDKVDFSVPPPEGLRVLYELEREFDGDSESPVYRDGPIQSNVDRITHVVRRVDAGHVVQVERFFDGLPALVEALSFDPERPDAPGSLTGTRGFRATWNGAEPSLEKRVDGAWSPVRRDSAYGFSCEELRSPFLPLGREVRRVGESWSVNARDALAGMFGGIVPLPTVEAGDSDSADVRFVSIVTDPPERPGRYALLELSVHLFGDRKPATIEGKALYDLTNRVIAHYEVTSRFSNEDRETGKKMRLTMRTTVRAARIAIDG